MNISEKLIALRKAHGLTQLQFAQIAGVSDKAVSTWELGKKEPRIRPLQKICDYFNININDLINPALGLDEQGQNEKPVTKGFDGLSDFERQVIGLLRQLPQNKKNEFESWLTFQVNNQ